MIGKNYLLAERLFQPVFEKKRKELRQHIHAISRENFYDQLTKIIRLDAELIQILRMLVSFEDENLIEEFMYKELRDFAIQDYYQFLQDPHFVDHMSLLYPTTVYQQKYF